jgi:hypothetical protein
MKRDEVLSKAEEYVNGPRAEDYGPAFDNFERIAEGWNIILSNALNTHGYFTPAHVALMMDWLKTARLLNNLHSEDGWVDKAGYAALGAECAQITRDRGE